MLSRFLKENISGNIIDIKMDARKTISFIMIRYEMIFNYLSGQIIKIIFEQQGVVCEPIYRCTLNIPNKEKVSWQIFSDERNFHAQNMVIVIWKWNKKEDIFNYRHLKGVSPKTQDKLPHLHAQVHICSREEIQNIFAKLALLDKILFSGINLEERKKSDFEKVDWNEIEIYRSYDWGMITGAWNRIKKNLQTEAITEDIDVFLMKVINCSSYKENFHLTFDYPYPVEDYIKKMIYGEV